MTHGKLKRRKLNSLRFAAFKFALIAYARPYKISYGMVKSKHEPLGNAHIPQEHLELHKSLYKKRSDLEADLEPNFRTT